MPTPLSWDEQEMDELERRIRNHPVPVDLAEKTLNRCRNEQMELPIRTSRRFLKTKIGAAAAMAVALVICSGYVSPAMAASLKQVPGIASLFRFADDLGLRTAEEQGLLTENDAASTHGGITLKAPVAVYDGTRVSVGLERSFESESSANVSLQEQMTSVELLIDGQSTDRYGKDMGLGFFTFPTTDKNASIIEMSDLKNQGGQPLPDRFELTVRATLAGVDEPFELRIPVERKADQSVALLPDVSREADGLSFKVNKVEFTPITTQITTELTFADDNRMEDRDRAALAYDVEDEQGHSLRVLSGTGHPISENVMVTDTRFEPFASVPHTLVIKPFRYVYLEGGDGAFALDQDGNPKKIYLPELELKIEVPSAPDKK
ncbi:hypothetical protein CDO73_20845 [Saccharibacillus sp. O23]|uniref:DUF4179 domain-containing protein n=1 Tax=Saccharibacillus sp. O23 TaxID=2009338 RepID=UPI000B4E5934|nr:DUF4179 domain-containing protein [Saccharibacillus sp. O23]OWR27802.1 hypothetical protein CDO73_20845 [Saccharibacillus sp. O23]